MFSTQSNLKADFGDFHLDRMMHYSVFVPRLNEQGTDNTDQIDLDGAIGKRGREREIGIPG
jgi:hypothetical protein